MKYNKEQFEILVKCLNILKKYIDIETINPNNLHFIIYQQFSDGQKHNRLIVNDGILKRKFTLLDGKLIENQGENIINFTYDFQLYPEGCNDNHIETAVKKAIKQFKI
jgi:hypothetical protein